MTEERLMLLLGGYDAENDTDSPIEAEFAKFDRVENKASARKDLHAFILLDKLAPGGYMMVACSVHDEITLEPTIADLVAGGITEEQAIELYRCGVRYDHDIESLRMYT